MPPKSRRQSMVPAKNARFSGRFDEVHVRELVARLVVAPLERLGDHADVLRPAGRAAGGCLRACRARGPRTIFGFSLAKPLFTASTSAMTSRLRFDTSTFAVPFGLSTTSSVRGVQPTQPFSRLRRSELVRVGVAGDERVFVEHEAELARRAASRRDRAARVTGTPGFLREIADEELALVELRGRERLARELRSPTRCRDRRRPCRRRASSRSAPARRRRTAGRARRARRRWWPWRRACRC